MNTEIDFNNILQSKDNYKLVKKVHDEILYSNSKIVFRIFPIYIKYFLDGKVLAIIYFKGKFVNPEQIVLGLNLKKEPSVKIFKDAKYMKDPNITYSFDIRNDIAEKDIRNIIKMIEC